MACRKDAPMVSEAEACELRPQIPEWQTIMRDGIPQLERIFKFKNFAQVLAFTLNAGELAETERHNPAIPTQWGKVTFTWWTHAISGSHRNDLVMAAKTDELFTG
jgi:4a-hydroxytetrahydrobiopterin dehydratase